MVGLVGDDRYSTEEIREACKEVFTNWCEVGWRGNEEDVQEVFLEIQEALLKLKGKPIV